MKKSLLLTFALAAMSAGTAFADDVVTLTFASTDFHQKYYASDGDWYTVIKSEPYEFMFDILESEDGLVSGQVYTAADMLTEYSFGIDYTDYTQIKYDAVSYVQVTLEDGSKNVEVEVQGENGVTYIISGIYTPSEEPEMIQMPEGLETIDCVLTCNDLDYGEEAFEAVLAFDGSDVYLEGCGYVSYFFQSVIKGTREGSKLIFPAGQCVGLGSTANYFIYGFSWDTFALQDVIFNYDESIEAYVSESEIVVTPGLTTQLENYYEFISEVVLTPSTPVAIENVKAEQKAAAKRFEDGKVMINANGMNYNAAGIRVK